MHGIWLITFIRCIQATSTYWKIRRFLYCWSCQIMWKVYNTYIKKNGERKHIYIVFFALHRFSIEFYLSIHFLKYLCSLSNFRSLSFFSTLFSCETIAVLSKTFRRFFYVWCYFVFFWIFAFTRLSTNSFNVSTKNKY